MVEGTHEGKDHSEYVKYEIDVDVGQFFVYLWSKDESVRGIVQRYWQQEQEVNE